MTHYLMLAVVSFFAVFILGFQSRNINSGEYKWAAGCSILIGASQVYIWKAVTMEDAGLADWLIYSLMGGVGIVSAMYCHRRFVKKGRDAHG